MAPYEKLHQELSDYTDNLGLIFKDFDQRLKALEQKAQVQHRWPIACVQLQRFGQQALGDDQVVRLIAAHRGNPARGQGPDEQKCDEERPAARLKDVAHRAATAS